MLGGAPSVQVPVPTVPREGCGAVPPPPAPGCVPTLRAGEPLSSVT